MLARTLLQAVFLCIAVTSINALYQKIVPYTDSACTIAGDGFFVNQNDCSSFPTDCELYSPGLYTKNECLESDPTSGISDMFVVRLYEKLDGTCNNGGDYHTAVVGRQGACFYGGGSGFFIFSGCNAPGENATITLYGSMSDCTNNVNAAYSISSIGDNNCYSGPNVDGRTFCPAPPPPVAVPVAEPVAPPLAAPIASAPVAAPTTPMAVPVASTTPVKKSSNASNAVVGFVSVVASWILLT